MDGGGGPESVGKSSEQGRKKLRAFFLKDGIPDMFTVFSRLVTTASMHK